MLKIHQFRCSLLTTDRLRRRTFRFRGERYDDLLDGVCKRLRLDPSLPAGARSRQRGFLFSLNLSVGGLYRIGRFDLRGGCLSHYESLKGQGMR